MKFSKLTYQTCSGIEAGRLLSAFAGPKNLQYFAWVAEVALLLSLRLLRVRFLRAGYLFDLRVKKIDLGPQLAGFRLSGTQIQIVVPRK